MFAKAKISTIRFRLAISLFFSGLGALIMEMAWIRYFQWVYGVAAHSAAIVLGVFMLGLAAGGIYWGAFVQRAGAPVRLLRRLFAAAAGFALFGVLLYFSLTPFVSHILAAQGSISAWFLKLLFVGIVVLPTTFCMGGTLPVSTWLLLSDKDIARTGFGSLSFFNLLGSFLGAIFTTYYLIESLGYWGSFCSGVLIVLAAILPTIGIAERENVIVAAESQKIDNLKQLFKNPYSASAFFAGFILFALELIWYRLLTPLTGGSAYAMGAIFATVLLGMALGSEFASFLDPERIRTRPLLPVVFLIMGSLLSLSYWIGDNWAIMASWGFAAWPDYPGKILVWMMLSCLLTMPLSFMVGMIVPFAFVKMKKGREDSGADSGVLLGVNSVGALVGSILFGFCLITWLGVVGSIKLLIAICLAGGLLLLVHHHRCNQVAYSPGKTLGVALLICALNALLVSTTGPTGAVRHSSVGFGTVSLSGKTENDRRQILYKKRRGIIWERDGSESSLAIDGSNGLTLLINGKSDGNIVGDASTQIMSGLIGAALHTAPRHVFVVGLGTGCSAGWLGQVDEVERVDVAEIEPLVVEMASRSWDANQKVMENSRVQIHFADARSLLKATTQKYDLIFSEPSHPYRSGMAGLFSIEFFKLVNEKLDENGIFTHFAPGYGVDLKTFAILYATLLKVFPIVETWQTQSGDMFLLCRKKPAIITPEDLNRRLMKEPFRQAMNSAWKTDSLDGFLAKFIGNTDLAKRVAAIVPESYINTDDRPLLELGYAKCMGKSSSLIIELRELALEQGFSQPSFMTDKVPEDRLLKHFPTLFTIAGKIVPLQEYIKKVDYLGEMHNAYLNNRFDQVVEIGKNIAIADQTILDRLIIGHSWIFSSTPEKVVPILQSLPGASFPEGYFLLAAYHFRCGEVKGALEPLLHFFAAVSKNPWVFRPFVVYALELAVMMVKKEPDLADSLCQAISQPFAGKCLDEARRLVLLELIPAEKINDQVSIIQSFEPYVPWYEKFLQIRKNAYEKTANPLAKQAAIDLETYLINRMQE